MISLVTSIPEVFNTEVIPRLSFKSIMCLALTCSCFKDLYWVEELSSVITQKGMSIKQVAKGLIRTNIMAYNAYREYFEGYKCPFEEYYWYKIGNGRRDLSGPCILEAFKKDDTKYLPKVFIKPYNTSFYTYPMTKKVYKTRRCFKYMSLVERCYGDLITWTDTYKCLCIRYRSSMGTLRTKVVHFKAIGRGTNYIVIYDSRYSLFLPLSYYKKEKGMRREVINAPNDTISNLLMIYRTAIL